ncbi:hypothetical protein [Salibacter sp.]|nr:hypothetical protein [Salibacter sp.]MDR9399254.1 hypothetical protein [Salibacter sp.]MDR9488618.1 hypothetical protein [Salibacter sp.]
MNKPDIEDKVKSPPVFKSWKGLYIFVLAFLLIQIVAYWFISNIW